MSRRRLVLAGVIIAVIGTVLMVVIGNVAVARTNPPVTHTINWDSPETERLARTACFDCHSNETRWPWYAHIAPMSFLVANDVANAREEMNFSTGYNLDAEEMVERIENGEMPLLNYLLLHPEANLSAEQKAQLIAGLQATFASGFRFQFGAPQGGEESPVTTPEPGDDD
ncbi:MAG: heme-binding domain-containing protein [Anaerolineae bacterium]|nr:heme-binding domain-containing protein [Anaerolineae bacterium]